MNKIITSITVGLLLVGASVVSLNQQVEASQESSDNLQYDPADILSFHDGLDEANHSGVDTQGNDGYCPLSAHTVDAVGRTTVGTTNAMCNLAPIGNNIAIVTVTSLDGVTTTVNGNYYETPLTYGKVFVHKSLAGNLPEGQEMDFVRFGGAIKTKDLFADAPQWLKDKLAGMEEYTNRSVPFAEDESYRTFSPYGNSQVEVGKTYLVYFSYSEPKASFVMESGTQYVLHIEGVPDEAFHYRSVMPNLSTTTVHDTCPWGDECKHPVSMSYDEYFDQYIKDKLVASSGESNATLTPEESPID